MKFYWLIGLLLFGNVSHADYAKIPVKESEVLWLGTFSGEITPLEEESSTF